MRAVSSLILGAVVALSACSGDKGLRDLSDPSAGPEEFTVLPGKALAAPKSYSALPTPTPGQSNLADVNPNANAIAALGGNPARLQDTGVSSSDSGLVQTASRYGVPGNIRATTAAEDADFRKRRGRFTRIRLFKTDRYGDVYKNEALDAKATISASRRAGLKTPTAPSAE